MKRTEPRKPPRMVSHSVDPSCLLNICIPAKTRTDSKLESTSEVPVFTAAKARDGDQEQLNCHRAIMELNIGPTVVEV